MLSLFAFRVLILWLHVSKRRALFYIRFLNSGQTARLPGLNHTMSAVFLWKYCFRITWVCWQSLQWLLQVGQRSARQTHDTDYKHGWQVFSQQSKESVRKVPGVDSHPEDFMPSHAAISSLHLWFTLKSWTLEVHAYGENHVLSFPCLS